MASEILVNLYEEVTCPICLELLTEPLSLECGHSFCQACLTMNSQKSTISSEDENSCPMCRSRYQPNNLRPNRHLANIVARFREVKEHTEEGQKHVCERHGEKLLLFCSNDGVVICWLCERSQEHKGHKTLLVEEVAQDYKVELEEALARLKKEQEKAEDLKNDIREEKACLKSQIQTEITTVQKEFNRLRVILDSEEQKELQKLQKEEEDCLQKLDKGEQELVQQSQLVGNLISDMERRLEASTVEMLQDVNGIMQRSINLNMRRSKPSPKKRRGVFKAPDLSGMFQSFRELTDVQCYWVFRTSIRTKTGQQTASSGLPGGRLIIEDLSCNINNDYALRGSLNINSGKHYWEVDLSRKTAWALGVYYVKNPDVKMQNFDVNQFEDCWFQRRHQSQHGYWGIRLSNPSKYIVFENSYHRNPWHSILCLNVPPCRVGVFLDYERGTISFFNVSNHGFLIYKFSNLSFSQIVCPYFNLMNCAVPMSLCSPGS
ncbi:tripartite motif-containing protein 5 isoform X2 [Echinops telfairi]|uniref:Tripartite motif-containing protein 5 isoform X2 n=1 Tax=Echinops telfairi TaxID=9371 RepID=A0ABM0J8D7_ECHTE|nr:tripartite motif-containing protein 5 isoform X2 [Echinops telfairi]